ncbi:MAG: hypothetical protein OHK0032_18720 [Thermodesulfovibrionales bacterium]
MPEISGRELSEKVRAFRKDIKFLFMSGYTDDFYIAKEVSEGKAEFLSKPFTVIELFEKVRKVLSG